MSDPDGLAEETVEGDELIECGEAEDWMLNPANNIGRNIGRIAGKPDLQIVFDNKALVEVLDFQASLLNVIGGSRPGEPVPQSKEELEERAQWFSFWATCMLQFPDMDIKDIQKVLKGKVELSGHAESCLKPDGVISIGWQLNKYNFEKAIPVIAEALESHRAA